MVSAQQVEVTLTEAGTLPEKIDSTQKYNITSLKVSGPINGTDVRYLREMAGKDWKNNDIDCKLVELDLVDANIVAGGKSYYSSYCTKEDTLGYCLFRDCRLTSIKLPNSVTSIGNSAFDGCTNLTSITIPNSVTSIDNYAFSGCTGLTSITIPNSVTSIGKSAFNGCTKLTSINIPNSVTNIGDYAFDGCSGLKKVIVEDVAAWCGISFANNNSNPLVYARHLYSDANTEIKDLKIPSSVTSIGNRAFAGCSSLTSIDIPSSVTSIGDDAFVACSSLTSIVIPNSVTSIGVWAFYNCSSLTSINIPNSVTNIGDCAFGCCSKLTKVIVEDIAAWCGISFAATGSNPLEYAKHLYSDENTEIKDLKIPSSVTSIGNYAFNNCASLTSIYIPNSVASIGESAFFNCASLTSIDIPDSVKSIGRWTFEGCTNLTTIKIPNSVTSIGECAFRKCSSLTSIVIPNSVTSIGGYAFCNCANLTSIDIPKFVTRIGNFTFYGCSTLTSITIPSSVTSIGIYAFEGCTGLTEVKLKGKTLPTCENESVFGGLTSDATLYCDAALVETCKNTNPWSSFKNIEALPLSLTITSAGIATACFDEDLDFTGLDMKAYIASGFNPETGKVLLTRAMQIPAGTGFIVKGNEGTYNLSAATTKYTYANLLVGTLEETSLSAVDGSYSNYVLRNDATLGVGFHTPVDGYVLPANKAYLRIPTSVSEAKSVMGLCFDGEDDTTGFIPVRQLTEGTNGQSAVYDLNGQRKQGLSKGLNIVNGKKILVK